MIIMKYFSHVQLKELYNTVLHFIALQYSLLTLILGKDKEDPNKDKDVLPRLSSELTLEELWDTLSECLVELARTSDRNAVLVLQPAVEAFFLVQQKKRTPHHRPLLLKQEPVLRRSLVWRLYEASMTCLHLQGLHLQVVP